MEDIGYRFLVAFIIGSFIMAPIGLFGAFITGDWRMLAAPVWAAFIVWLLMKKP